MCSRVISTTSSDRRAIHSRWRPTDQRRGSPVPRSPVSYGRGGAGGAADAVVLLQAPRELAQAVVAEQHARDCGDRPAVGRRSRAAPAPARRRAGAGIARRAPGGGRRGHLTRRDRACAEDRPGEGFPTPLIAARRRPPYSVERRHANPARGTDTTIPSTRQRSRATAVRMPSTMHSSPTSLRLPIHVRTAPLASRTRRRREHLQRDDGLLAWRWADGAGRRPLAGRRRGPGRGSHAAAHRRPGPAFAAAATSACA
jgi:hypothetical protein